MPFLGALGELDFENREDIEELGVEDSIAAVSWAADMLGNDAYHWTKSKADRDATLKAGLGKRRKYVIESHEVASAYVELSESSRRRLVKKYGSPGEVVSEGQLDVEKAYKKDNPTYVRVWIAANPEEGGAGEAAANAYGPYGVRVRLADYIAEQDPWGVAIEDFAFGYGLTLDAPIPSQYLSPVEWTSGSLHGLRRQR